MNEERNEASKRRIPPKGKNWILQQIADQDNCGFVRNLIGDAEKEYKRAEEMYKINESLWNTCVHTGYWVE